MWNIQRIVAERGAYFTGYLSDEAGRSHPSQFIDADVVVSLDANVPDEPFCALDELARAFGLPESELPLGEPWVREPPARKESSRDIAPARKDRLKRVTRLQARKEHAQTDAHARAHQISSSCCSVASGPTFTRSTYSASTGEDLTGLPLLDRKRRLLGIMPIVDSRLLRLDHIHERGSDLSELRVSSILKASSGSGCMAPVGPTAAQHRG